MGQRRYAEDSGGRWPAGRGGRRYVRAVLQFEELRGHASPLAMPYIDHLWAGLTEAERSEVYTWAEGV